MRFQVLMFSAFMFASAPSHAANTAAEEFSDAVNVIASEVDLMASRKPEASLCQSDKVTQLIQDLASAQSRLASYNSMIYANDPRYGAGAKYRAKITVQQNMPQLISSQFKFADYLLSAKCLDQADGLYRDIIIRYVGASYEAWRERAKLGVDDVRAARVR